MRWFFGVKGVSVLEREEGERIGLNVICFNCFSICFIVDRCSSGYVI